MDRELALLNRAASQEGLIKRADALKLLTVDQLEWRLRRLRWQQVRPNVYCVTGAPQTRAQQLRAIFMWLGRTFAFSHRTAAALLGFRGYSRNDALEVTVTGKRGRQHDMTIHRVRALPKSDLTTIDEFPVTTVERTLVAVAPGETKLKALVDDLLSRKKTSLDFLFLALLRLDPHGRSPLWKLVDAYRGGDAPTESELERRVFELLMRSGLPLPIKQKALYIAGRLRRLDFLFELFGVVIEADGYLTHSDTEAFESDRERNNALVEKGLLVLHWTWTAVQKNPEPLLAQLRAVLISRGWRP